MFIQRMIKDDYMQTESAASYQKNFLQNLEYLFSLRYFHHKGYIRNDSLYSHESQGFSSHEINTAAIKDLLKDDINNLKRYKHSPEGLDRSILINIDNKAGGYREDLSELLGDICKNKLCINQGFEEGTVRYKPRSATLHYSDYKDTHGYMTRLDEFPKPILLNMHIDPLFTTRKIMIYLGDTDLNSGPFSYVPESNLYLIDTPTLLKIKSFGKANYWPRSHGRESLKVLPEALGLTNVFGSTCGSQKEDMWLNIAKQEVLFTGNENAILFSPCGFHRGGINTFGKERIALQVILDLRRDAYH